MELITSAASPAELQASAARMPTYRPLRYDLARQKRQREEKERLEGLGHDAHHTEHGLTQKLPPQMAEQRPLLPPRETSVPDASLDRQSEANPPRARSVVDADEELDELDRDILQLDPPPS
jgi:hypothetical protein